MKNTVQYYTQGHGSEHLIFLHGWLSDYKVFESILTYFDNDKYTIVCPDYRGYGRSKLLTGNYTINEITDDIINLLDQLEWKETNIIGHSMAGQVIQKIALKRPDLIRIGVAISPVPASGLEIDEATRDFFQSSVNDDKALSQIFRNLTGDRHSDAFINVMVANTRMASTRSPYLGYLKSWTETNFAKEVGSIKSPIVVIAGVYDGAFNPDVMNESYMKQLSNVSMKTIQSAGHYPMQEAPVELFSIIEEVIA